MIVVSYFTPRYAEDAKGLVRTLDDFNLRHDIHAVDDLGGWQRNTQYKAAFMRRMLDEHSDEDVLWLDADARVRQRPVLFDVLGTDIAVHYRDGRELLSGTLWMRPNETTRALCDLWIQRCSENSGEWDQRALQWAIEQSPELRVHRLPPTYTMIFDTMAHHGPPVIEHMQASRRLKR